MRYLRKRKIAYFAVAAVMLCSAMVLIVMSVMGGFLDNVKLRARGLLGDLVVDNQAYAGFPLYEEFLSDVRQMPEIVAATPLIYSYGLIRFQSSEQTGTIRVVGVRLNEIVKVNAFQSGLFYETQYPGTTTLEPQQQPQLGMSWRPKPHPTLPEPFRSAYQQAREDGVPIEGEEIIDFAGGQMTIPPGYFSPGPLIQDIDTPAELIGDPLPGLIIGRYVVADRRSDGSFRRYYQKGEMVTLTLVRVGITGSVDTPIKQPFRYADDSRTGIYEIDNNHAYCDFDLLQTILEMNQVEFDDGTRGPPARCSQIQIKTAPGTDNRALANRLQALYQSYLEDERFTLDRYDRSLIGRINVKTWEQSQAHIIGPVERERVLVTILFGIVSLVAAVLVLCILYMIVLQKTRDIGIVKAIGGSSAGVATIFLMYGAAVGLVGGLLGITFGYYFVININAIEDLLIAMNPAWQVWDRSVYSFDEIPNTVRTGEMIAIFIAAVVFATLGSILAAWRAGAMDPLEALRHE